MKHVMKKNSGGGDCDPRPKASESETTVGWSSYIALHIKEAKNRIRVLHDLKFRIISTFKSARVIVFFINLKGKIAD